MNQQAQQLLQQMRPLHLPQELSWWPIATAWYVLLIVLVILISSLVYFWLKHKANTLYKREAATKLQQISELFNNEKINSSQALQELSLILKQLALTLFPRQNISSLHGERWLAQLDKIDQSNFFSQGEGRLLGSNLYQSQQTYDQNQVEIIFNHCKLMIKKLKLDSKRRQHDAI